MLLDGYPRRFVSAIGMLVYHENKFNYNTKYESSYINIYFLYHILNRKETEIFGNSFFIRFTQVLSRNMQGHNIRFKNTESTFHLSRKIINY